MQLTIMPSQIEVAPPEAISGMDGSILYIYEMRLHLIQEHRWIRDSKSNPRMSDPGEVVEARALQTPCGAFSGTKGGRIRIRPEDANQFFGGKVLLPLLKTSPRDRQY